MKSTVLQYTPHEALCALARVVKTVRLEQEMTIEELASRVGVSRSSIIRFEKSGAGSTETEVKIFAALGMLDLLVSVFEPPAKEMTIAELKKMSNVHQRQRGRRKTCGVS
jgi:transcriptional regulator with XRE-family HTH domain